MKIKVCSKPERFRRAGHEFTRESRVVDVDEKTLNALKVEPMLVVTEVVEEEEKSKGKGK